MLTVAGANGGPGLSARCHVEGGSSSGDASVITPPLRAVGGAAWESLNSRKTATYTSAQVGLSDQPTLNWSFELRQNFNLNCISLSLASNRGVDLHYPLNKITSLLEI